MKVKCKNGLCDRLGMIFSYLHHARSKGDHLEVCWPIDQECNGHFLEIFQPVENMFFTEDESNLDFYGFQPHKDHDPKSKFIYQDLSLLPETQRRINDVKSQMGSYAAIHVRRTDKLDPIKAPWFVNTEDDEFFNFIDKQKRHSVFLASDCRETQETFTKRYGDRIFYSSLIEPSQSLRQTSLVLAAIDLFVCIYAKDFFGTNASGFTHFILQNRQHRRVKLI